MDEQQEEWITSYEYVVYVDCEFIIQRIILSPTLQIWFRCCY